MGGANVVEQESIGLEAICSAQDAHREHLRKIIQEVSFSRGKAIRLASGRTSEFYFDMKPTMLDPQAAYLVATLILAQLEGEEVDFIGGLEMGAVPIVSSVAAISWQSSRPVPAFFVRKQPKAHGAKNLIEGLAPNCTLAGKQVIIVDDVTTTGGSVLLAVNAARNAGAHVRKVIAIVDRLEGASDNLEAEKLAFTSLFDANDFR